MVRLLIFTFMFSIQLTTGVRGESVTDSFCHPSCFDKCLPSCTCCHYGLGESERRNKIRRKHLEHVLKQQQLEVGFVCHSYCKKRCLPSCRFECCQAQNKTKEVDDESVLLEQGFDLTKLLKSLQETQKEYRKFKTYIVKVHNITKGKKLNALDYEGSADGGSGTESGELPQLEKDFREDENGMIPGANHFVETNDDDKIAIHKKASDEKGDAGDVYRYNYNTRNEADDRFLTKTTKGNDVIINYGDKKELEEEEDDIRKYQGNPRAERTGKHLKLDGNYIYNPFYLSRRLKGMHIRNQRKKKPSRRRRKMIRKKSARLKHHSRKRVRKRKRAKHLRKNLHGKSFNSAEIKHRSDETLQEIQTLQEKIEENIELSKGKKRLPVHHLMSDPEVKVEIYDRDGNEPAAYMSDDADRVSYFQGKQAPSMFQEFQEITSQQQEQRAKNGQSSYNRPYDSWYAYTPNFKQAYYPSYPAPYPNPYIVPFPGGNFAKRCVSSCQRFCHPYCAVNCCQMYFQPQATKKKMRQKVKTTKVTQIAPPKRPFHLSAATAAPSLIQSITNGLRSTNATKLSEATLSDTRHRIQDLISLLQETAQNIQHNAGTTTTNVCHIGCKRHCLPSCHFECC